MGTLLDFYNIANYLFLQKQKNTIIYYNSEPRLADILQSPYKGTQKPSTDILSVLIFMLS